MHVTSKINQIHIVLQLNKMVLGAGNHSSG
jgi:hypothetical protein